MKVQKKHTVKQALQELLARLQMALSLVTRKGVDNMTNMVILMAVNIIEGRYSYNRVTKKLKQRVLEQLHLAGLTVNEQGELVEYKG